MVFARSSGMGILALATDYDGTLATEGTVDRATCHALLRFKQAGGVLVLVTGRELGDLLRVFPETSLFDRIVAENGALLYDPIEHCETLLTEPTNARFVQALRDRQVVPLAVGKAIVATLAPHEDEVRRVIAELGLELGIILNKGAVMVLPTQVNKRSGLVAAAAELKLPYRRIACVGDAENDHALLDGCGLAVAVQNAIPSLKTIADRVTVAAEGAGVVELIEHVLTGNWAERSLH